MAFLWKPYKILFVFPVNRLSTFFSLIGKSNVFKDWMFNKLSNKSFIGSAFDTISVIGDSGP